jgi:hypothetical protein
MRKALTTTAALVAATWIGLSTASLHGQTDGAKTPAAAPYSPPRTPWGDPDLQGIWPATDMIGVPFERPAQFGTRLYLTDAELKVREEQAKKQAELDVLDFDIEKPPEEIKALGDVGNETSPPPHWLERGKPSRQSSLIVEPANGKMPAMTPEGIARQKGSGGTYTKQTGWEQAGDLSGYDRCVSRGVVGSMMPVVYNNGNEIIQGPGYVAFRNEMIHETRIIPLDGRPALPGHMKAWMGDSRGHWEGTTLVVRTTNTNGKTGIQGNGSMLIASDALVLTERFTPLSADALQYEVTIDDPKTWTAPWKIAFPLKRESSYQIFEYACHEGNNAMRNTLSGSRADEKAAQK